MPPSAEEESATMTVAAPPQPSPHYIHPSPPPPPHHYDHPPPPPPHHHYYPCPPRPHHRHYPSPPRPHHRHYPSPPPPPHHHHYHHPPPSLPPHYFHHPPPPPHHYYHHPPPPPPPPSAVPKHLEHTNWGRRASSQPESSCFGIVLLYVAKLNLEVFGGAGAVWGFSEVVGLRTPETLWFWRPAAMTVGAIFLLRWIWQFYTACLQRGKNYGCDDDETTGDLESVGEANLAVIDDDDDDDDESLSLVEKKHRQDRLPRQDPENDPERSDTTTCDQACEQSAGRPSKRDDESHLWRTPEFQKSPTFGSIGAASLVSNEG